MKNKAFNAGSGIMREESNRAKMSGVAMNTIIQSLDKFTESVNLGQPVNLTIHGEWYISGKWAQAIRRIFRMEESRLMALADTFGIFLDNLEKIPVRFGGVQEIDFHSFLAAGEAIVNQLQGSKSHAAFIARNCLNRKLIGLKYRLESVNNGLDRDQVQADLVQELAKAAQGWKKQQDIFFEKGLTDEDLKKFQQVSQYPALAELLLVDENLMKQFLLWSLRDKNGVEVFAEFPALQHKLVATNLNGRIGRIGAGVLKIEKRTIDQSREVLEKVVTLPFEGKEISILDDQKEITFRGNYTMTIAEVFQTFSNKTFLVGNLEFLAGGITNWNVHKWGSWNADKNEYDLIDLSRKNDWWMQLPLFEILTTGQAQKRYGGHLDGQLWNAAATATRGSATLDFEQTHAFLELAIPLGDGNYAVYDFGKFATHFPKNFVEGLRMFCHTAYATVAYPDENIFYTHRQLAYHSFPMTPDQAKRIMESIRRDIILGRAENFVYQIESENCAKWLHEKLQMAFGERHMPNLFQIHLLHTEPLGFCKYLFGFIKTLPAHMHIAALNFFHLVLGARKETMVIENGEVVVKSLTTHQFWETGIVYLPAFLHRQLETGALAPVNEAAIVKALARIRLIFSSKSFQIVTHAFKGLANYSVPATEDVSSHKLLKQSPGQLTPLKS